VPDRLRTFQEVLTAAIEDMTANGFDSMERVQRWTRELGEAAERSMISTTSLEQQMREALSAIYRRMVDQEGLLKFNPGVERYTLEKIKPALRGELDRRIMASANLIKLNRAEAINSTLRRFQGWSTSIPPGGVSAETRPQVRKTVRKSLASLPFEQRRVLIDQGHKLVSSLSEIVASDGGAIAGKWRSHWRQPGYNYREDHKERDEKIYLVRGSWADQAGLVKPGKNGYYDDITAVGQEPFCRCYMIWIYALRDLPADMVTARGRASLVQARQEMARGFADDDVPPSQKDVFAAARKLDVLGYTHGMGGVKETPDRNQWHAQYQPDDDTITLQKKFEELPFPDRLHIALHEIGHRGQSIDPEAFEAFKRLHVNKAEDFMAMANPVHLEDFRRRKTVDAVDSEAFAESYARFLLDLDMPIELHGFWRDRMAARADAVDSKVSKREAQYVGPRAKREGGFRCDECTMFEQPERCTKVQGIIDPGGYCKHFSLKIAFDNVRPVLGNRAIQVKLQRLREEVGG